MTLLFVNTAQGQVGRDVAALVGGTLLNLVDGVIRSQEALPAAERKRVTVVVDEMQAIPGADYEAMLSELGKFGASFVMATQSLTRLEDLSRTLRETLFSNIGCLVAFQTSASDARYLTWELDRDQVTEEDLTSLPVHHCYVLHFFLELERRAEWRGRFLEKLRPYLRYYASGQPLETFGEWPAVLFVFRDEIAEVGFLRASAGEAELYDMDEVLPLFTTTEGLVAKRGPLDTIWRLEPGGQRATPWAPEPEHRAIGGYSASRSERSS